MIINTELLNKLTVQAQSSSRLRMHYDLRDSEEDQSQRMLNTIEPGTVIIALKKGKFNLAAEKGFLNN